VVVETQKCGQIGESGYGCRRPEEDQNTDGVDGCAIYDSIFSVLHHDAEMSKKC
jgi:hypothetical protein